jgi:hypothetical protein
MDAPSQHEAARASAATNCQDFLPSIMQHMPDRNQKLCLALILHKLTYNLGFYEQLPPYKIV